MRLCGGKSQPIAPRAGRTRWEGAAAPGALVSEVFGEQAWPDESPLGKRFALMSTGEPIWVTVVGVVGSVGQWNPEDPALPEAYFYPATGGYVVTKVTEDPTRLTADVRRAVLAVDPTQPPSGFRTMTDRVEAEFAQRRFYTTLIGLFAATALILAATGIYGTVSYFVARRTRELGVRLALGATRRSVVGLVVRRGTWLAAWGVGLGLFGVWGANGLWSPWCTG